MSNEEYKEEAKPKVTVVIPAYNAADTIAAAIESVPIRDDVEIVVIDDGSADDTRKILSGITRKKYFFESFAKNFGVAAAVNWGIESAHGEYVVLLGADDDFYPEEFEKAMEQLDGTDLVYFDLRINSGEIWHVDDKTKQNICGSVKFMRREFIGNTRNDETKRAGEDYDFYQKLLAKNPTEKFTGLVVKHYNFPREGSLFDRLKKGEFKE